MAIACVRIPHLAISVAILNHPHLANLPLAVGDPEKTRALVMDVNEAAHRAGVRAGMSLREAKAQCMGLEMVVPNPVLEHRVRRRILFGLDEISPLVQADPDDPGCWYVDLVGLDRHHPSTTAAATRMLADVPVPLAARAGVASTMFAARVASGRARAGEVFAILPDDERAFLARQSAAWLPIAATDINRLARMGLVNLGLIAAIPPARITAHLGPSGRIAWELATGVDRRLVTPAARPQTLTIDLPLEAPTASREMLLIGLTQMIRRAFARHELRDRGVREMLVQAVVEGGRSWERRLVLREPTGVEGVVRAVGLRLQDLVMEGAVEQLSITLSGLVDTGGTQLTIPTLRARQNGSLQRAVQHLKHRYGTSPIYKVIEVQPWSRLPERRHALISYVP